MQRSDWFAVFVSVFVLGAGAFLSTYPTEIIRETGIVLMAGALIGLAMWFSRGSVRRKMISLLPWALIIGGPIVGVVWLYLAKEQKLPGFASYAVIRLYDRAKGAEALRRRARSFKKTGVASRRFCAGPETC